MKTGTMILTVLTAFCLAVPTLAQEPAAKPAPVGKVVAIQGTVQVGQAGQWQPCQIEQPLFDGQSIKTGPKSAAKIVFTPDLAMEVSEGTEILIGDLLLKARLEKVKASTAAPTTTQKTEMQVTPLTGVRGTDQSGEKSEELKREHFWNEQVQPSTQPAPAPSAAPPVTNP